ncbi:MAG: bifunctional 5,10-methylene-tetrahydrofolate dehydrogenase/5,10-methylene-tetrahydrofolate cyclohydrolase, partial [Thermoplasmata archaeon]|nr:bifunctional 5,10-methylene-tetrahydrofolate dehydrogenase/5,10-methylene-tetrahydrofolate cyclohydrolase [Thermoplasmata archaeon]
MTAQVIKGDVTSAEIKSELSKEIEELKVKGITPGLAAVIVGENPASKVYVRMKRKACDELGMHSETFVLSHDAKMEELTTLVDKLNDDPLFHGILIQLPLPSQMNESEILKRVDPKKDVDCFHPYNLGLLYLGEPVFKPCTPAGVVELLLRYGYNPEGK